MDEKILLITKKFHDTYERLSKDYNYETRKATKIFDITSNNGKLMYATVNEVVSPILKENQELKKQLEVGEEQYNDLVEEKESLQVKKKAKYTAIDIYNRVLNEFGDLIKGNVKEVKISLFEMGELDYSIPSYDAIWDNDGNFICLQLNGRYNNCVNVLRKFCKQHNIIQTEDLINDVYIFRVGDDKE